jgi:hypothetical protein
MYMYYNNMRDSGLPLFVSLFPYSSHNPLPDIWLRNACSGHVPGVTSVLHELRGLAKVTRKSSAKTYTCQCDGASGCLLSPDWTLISAAVYSMKQGSEIKPPFFGVYYPNYANSSRHDLRLPNNGDLPHNFDVTWHVTLLQDNLAVGMQWCERTVTWWVPWRWYTEKGVSLCPSFHTKSDRHSLTFATATLSLIPLLNS